MFNASAQPTFMVHVAMLGWFPLCLAIFSQLGVVRGVAVGLVAGLFALPNAGYDLPGLPAYDKMMATCVTVGFAAMVFDARRMTAFRPKLIDLPILLFCLVPWISGVRGGMGSWFGMSESFRIFVTWGFPWILGRVYLSSPGALRFFLLTLVGASLVYLPLCLYEIKMSPQIHEFVYGIRLKSIKHAERSIGFRPNVMLEHGLMAAMVLSMSALAAFWAWRTRMARKVVGVPIGPAFFLLAGLTLATQSSNAILMLFVGCACLVLCTSTRRALPLLALVLVPPTYVLVRNAAGWDGAELVEAAEGVFGERRANSLRFRIENENLLKERSHRHPWFGWGAIASFTGNDGESFNAIIDSLWQMLLGIYGYVGLVLAYAAMLLPGWLVWKRLPVGLWRDPRAGPAAVLGLVVCLYALDCLLNAFPNPLFMAAAGGVVHLLGTKDGRRQLSITLGAGQRPAGPAHAPGPDPRPLRQAS